MRLSACDRVLEFPPTQVMGIINVTPDSFSDGGQFLDSAAAVAQGIRLVEEGADMLDIGGESSRPGAPPVEEEEELRRVLPVVEQLSGAVEVPISIDTQKTVVARKALSAGAVIINDVAANREDEAMWRLVADTGAGYIAMHMRGTPQTMQEDPRYDDVTNEVESFFQDRLERLAAVGVLAEQVALDPGIGFGKRLQHNLELIRNIEELRICQRPILVGLSRKRFIGTLLGHEVGQRDIGTVAANMVALFAGANMLRVHNVPYTKELVSIFAAIQCGSRTEDSDS